LSSTKAHAQAMDTTKTLEVPTKAVVLKEKSTEPKNEQILSPKKVWRRSAIIPGWGQLTNKQAWKIPIVYGLLGGLIYTTRTQTLKYHDYRAAFYNLNNTDQRYGPTPDYLVNQTNGSFLQNVRDNTRQQRDQLALGLVLAYGLNIIDSYVYAHFRTFDVSDNLSLNTIEIENGPNGPFHAISLKLNF
jgi:hypothetical protein